MSSIVEYPTLVQQALQTFGDLFANEPQRHHFAEYLTGWMIAERKTVSGINREFVAPTDQSCLNRWLTEEVLARDIPGDFTFDSYFSSAEVLNPLQDRQRAYVGDLKLNRKGVYHGTEHKLNVVATQIPPQAKKPIQVGAKTYWYFTKRMRIPDVHHPVRILLFWKQRNDLEASKALVSNRLTWEPTRLLLVYRHRWTGTETFHRDAKQQLGLGDCQVRTGEGQTRHFYLVCVAYSLLMRSLHRKCPQQWARVRLTTIGQACRAIKAETLGY